MCFAGGALILRTRPSPATDFVGSYSQETQWLTDEFQVSPENSPRRRRESADRRERLAARPERATEQVGTWEEPLEDVRPMVPTRCGRSRRRGEFSGLARKIHHAV